MRILFITERYPFPPNSGGKIRTLNVLKALSNDHDVTLVCTVNFRTDLGSKTLPSGIVANTHIIPLRMKWFREFQGIYLTVRRDIPHLISRHYYKPLANAIRKMDLSRFDAVHFDHLDSTLYYDLIPKDIPMFLDEHNIVTNQVDSVLRSVNSSLKKTYIMRQLETLRRYESKIAQKMTTCFVCSKKDRDRLQRIAPGAEIRVAPNGIDLEYYSPKRDFTRTNKSILFVGSLDYFPNVVAVEWFFNNIWPPLKKRFPELEFYIVGKNPPKALTRRLSNDPRINITGKVEDVRPYYHKSLVSIVPLLSGSGTRLKILEAMACGVPVVSTSIGAEGLGAINNKHLFIADHPREFVDRVIRLLLNPRERDLISYNAYRFVKREFSWEHTLASVRDCYMQCMDNVLKV